MRTFIITLAILAGIAAPMVVPANAQPICGGTCCSNTCR
jgi:hypothetical protein